uniref:Uncharacterized protein n=2 Tax=Gloeothece TaxID=28070 RepID=E0UBT1_GLOV7|nr:conserved hypothetical protein [Gloeothece verrucosa PCC 7822]
MIELFTGTVIAIGSVIAQKTLEKTEDKVSDILSEKISQFINALTKTAPKIATALALAPEQPLDYGQAVLEVETAAKNNTELSQSIDELAKAAEAEPPPNITEILQKIDQELQQKQFSIQNLAKLTEKINNFNQAQTIHIIQNNTF